MEEMSDRINREESEAERWKHIERAPRIEEATRRAPEEQLETAGETAEDRYGAIIDQLCEAERQRDEAYKSLGEAGVTIRDLESQIQSFREAADRSEQRDAEVAAQLREAERQRDEAYKSLGEARVTIHDLEGRLLSLREAADQSEQRAIELAAQLREIERQRDEANWFLGEARAALSDLEGQLQSLREAAERLERRDAQVTPQLEEAERQRDEAYYYLGKSRASEESLCQWAQELNEQLARTRSDLEETQRLLRENQQRLDSEQTQRRLIEGELLAVQTYGERRRGSRVHRADLTVEVESPDGTLLFSGTPRDISRRGLKFASALPVTDIPGYLHVRLYVPEGDFPIDATGRLVWQGETATPPLYLIGCELTSIPADSRETFERVLAFPN